MIIEDLSNDKLNQLIEAIDEMLVNLEKRMKPDDRCGPVNYPHTGAFVSS